MREVRDQLGAVEKSAEEIKRALASLPWNKGMQNLTIVRVEGLGAAGMFIALGLCIGLGLWVGWALGDIRDQQRQQDAFIQAAYQYAPKWRDEYHKIEQEFSDVQRSDPHPDRSPAAPAAAPGR